MEEAEKDGDMNRNIVRRTVDLTNLPPLTEAQKAELAALALRPESEIDYSDIPPLTEEFLANAHTAWICAELTRRMNTQEEYYPHDQVMAEMKAIIESKRKRA